jgi:hypothetical protein
MHCHVALLSIEVLGFIVFKKKKKGKQREGGLLESVSRVAGLVKNGNVVFVYANPSMV